MQLKQFEEKNKNSIGYLLYHMTMALQRNMKRELDPLNITHTQFIVLATVYRLSQKKTDITQIDISNESKTDKMMVSKILRTLEKKKMVTRIEHSTDTRAKVVNITEEGIDLFNKAFQNVKKVETQFFKHLGENREQFVEQLNTLIAKNNIEI